MIFSLLAWLMVPPQPPAMQFELLRTVKKMVLAPLCHSQFTKTLWRMLKSWGNSLRAVLEHEQDNISHLNSCKSQLTQAYIDTCIHAEEVCYESAVSVVIDKEREVSNAVAEYRCIREDHTVPVETLRKLNQRMKAKGLLKEKKAKSPDMSMQFAALFDNDDDEDEDNDKDDDKADTSPPTTWWCAPCAEQRPWDHAFCLQCFVDRPSHESESKKKTDDESGSEKENERETEQNDNDDGNSGTCGVFNFDGDGDGDGNANVDGLGDVEAQPAKGDTSDKGEAGRKPTQNTEAATGDEDTKANAKTGKDQQKPEPSEDKSEKGDDANTSHVDEKKTSENGPASRLQQMQKMYPKANQDGTGDGNDSAKSETDGAENEHVKENEAEKKENEAGKTEDENPAQKRLKDRRGKSGIQRAVRRGFSLLWAVSSASGYKFAEVEKANKMAREADDKKLAKFREKISKKVTKISTQDGWCGTAGIEVATVARFFLDRDRKQPKQPKPPRTRRLIARARHIERLKSVRRKLKAFKKASNSLVPKCEQKHSLAFDDSEFYFSQFCCDKCGATHNCSVGAWRCAVCRYDMCMECFIPNFFEGAWKSPRRNYSIKNLDVWNDGELLCKIEVRDDPAVCYFGSAGSWVLNCKACDATTVEWHNESDDETIRWKRGQREDDRPVVSILSVKQLDELFKKPSIVQAAKLYVKHQQSTNPLDHVPGEKNIAEKLYVGDETIEQKSAILTEQVAIACFVHKFNEDLVNTLPWFDLSKHDDRTNLASLIVRCADLIYWKVKHQYFGRLLGGVNISLANDELQFSVNRMRGPLCLEHDLPWRVCLQNSLLGQLLNQFRKTSAFRLRGYGEDSRIFAVKFEGEGSEDAGGPYREAITQVCADLQNPRLNLFSPVPNCVYKLGLNREKFIPNPSSKTPELLEYYRFIGVMMGICIRTKFQLDLEFPRLLWKRLIGQEIDESDLKDIDEYTTKSLNDLANLGKGADDDEKTAASALSTLTFTYNLSDDTPVELKPGGSAEPVTPDNLAEFIALAKQLRLNESNAQISAMREGLATIVPIDALRLFTWSELEILVCGKSVVDIDLLKKNTNYKGDLKESDPHIQLFWKALHSFSNEDRQKLLRFVWGRSRLPLDNDFHENFQIDTCAGGENSLPIAHTCFFTLDLPRYSTLEIMQSRLTYAMENCMSIDTDFAPDEHTNHWEIEELSSLAQN